MASNSNHRELRAGKTYHSSILYNYHEGPSNESNPDHDKSLAFVEQLDSVLVEEGFHNNYYHDKFTLGTNFFDVLSDMINLSEKIVVVFTRGFLCNLWHKHCDQTALKFLTDSGEKHRLVFIAVGLKKEDLPIELGTSAEFMIYFNENFEEDSAWDQVVRRFNQNNHMQNFTSGARTTVEESSNRTVDTVSQLGRSQSLPEQDTLSSPGRSWSGQEEQEQTMSESDVSRLFSGDFVQMDTRLLSQQRTSCMSGESVLNNVTFMKQPIEQSDSLQQYNLEESSDRTVDTGSELGRSQEEQEQTMSEGDDSRFWSDDFVQMDTRLLSQQRTGCMSEESVLDDVTTLTQPIQEGGSLQQYNAVVNRSCEKASDEPDGCGVERCRCKCCRYGCNGGLKIPNNSNLVILSLLIAILAIQLYTFVRT